jgi:hypothetical protein
MVAVRMSPRAGRLSHNLQDVLEAKGARAKRRKSVSWTCAAKGGAFVAERSVTMAESEHRVWEYVAVQKSNPEQLAAALDKLDGEGYREIVSVSLGGPSTACSAILKRPATRPAVAAVR